MPGRRPGLMAATLLALAGSLAQPDPAAAQLTSFLDGIFGRKEQPAPETEPTPAAKPAPKKAAAKPAEPKAADGKAADGKAADAKTTDAKTGESKSAERKAPKATEKPAEKVAAVSAPVSPAAQPEDADPATVLAQANAYFNGLGTLNANFVQIGADGRRIGGKLILAKPGRLRFDYDEPSPLQVVADGTSVAVRDRKLVTQDLYFIAQTPLKFLLREKIDLARDLTVTEVTSDPGGVRIGLEDRATLGGTSKIQLFFDAGVKTLSQWRITDPQGYQTVVQLSNLQKGKAVDATLFVINYGRAEDRALQEQIQKAQQGR